jgi:hypothetical protein
MAERRPPRAAKLKPMSMKAKRRWSAKLACPITLKDGTTLATLADVRTFVLNEPEHVQERNAWQRVAALLMEAAENGGSIEAATAQLVELGLFF